MNMRKAKRAKIIQMQYVLLLAQVQFFDDEWRRQLQSEVTDRTIAAERIFLEHIAQHMLEGSSGEGHSYAAPNNPAATVALFTVARKKDGVVVGTYESLAEAEAVILKAKTGKKAALQLQ